MALSYPLLFPYSDDGYRVAILHRIDVNRLHYKWHNLSMREYYTYHLQVRANEGKIILLSRRLLQQFIINAYMTIKEEMFKWICNNRKKFRSDLYHGLMDAMYRGDIDLTIVSKTFILPFSYLGSPRYRVQNY